MQPIRSASELYAHAIALEREAAQRYAEFAERMQDLGNPAAAEVFDRLAGFEAEHLSALLARSEGIATPAVGSWADAPETAPLELARPLLSVRQALLIALHAEQRAEAFFEGVLMSADDPRLRALAGEMAAEEAEHAELLRRLLEVDLHQNAHQPAF